MTAKQKNTRKNGALIKVNLGCGVHLLSGFINVDKYFSLKQLQSKKGIYKNAIIEPGAKYVQADAIALPFRDNSVDYIESIDMIEHLPTQHVAKAFSEIARVLKPGGKLGMMTNSFDNLAQLWVQYMTKPDFTQEQYFELCELIYGNQIGPGEFHRTPFNPRVLNSFIVDVGLTLDKMTMYTLGSTDSPKMETQTWPQSSHLRSDMMWVQAHK